MRILVTGHRGYVGTVTAATLAAAGHDVVGLDTNFYDDCDFGPPNGAVAEIRRDVRDVERRDLEGFDAVVHLAGLSNDPMGALDPRLTEAINFRATRQIALDARAAGATRFVFASSCSMYGAAGAGASVDESAPLLPLTEYARSKVDAEKALVELAGDDFSPVLMRNATVYGASPRLRVDLVVNNLAGWAHTTGAIRILSDGTPWRPLVHVADVAAATLALLEAPRERVHAQAFNVGAPDENYQVRDVAEIVREETEGCTVEYAGTGDPDLRSYRVDFSKLAETVPELELGWNVRSGARELLDAYARHGLTREDFDGPRYTRLARLDALREAGSITDDLRWR